MIINNILINPDFIQSVLEGVNRVSFYNIIRKSSPNINYSRTVRIFSYIVMTYKFLEFKFISSCKVSIHTAGRVMFNYRLTYTHGPKIIKHATLLFLSFSYIAHKKTLFQ